ncbi:MAG: hypothetical protein IJD39_00750 [Clostridia bacterium]|nr:hypothetical protein [Clostridia bacterium]
MIASGLKNYASEMNLTIESGVAYGWLENCFVSFSEGAGYKRLSIYIGCHHAPDEEQPVIEGQLPAHFQAADRVADLILEKAGDPKKYRLMPRGKGMNAVVLAQGGSVVHVNFFDNPGTLKCIRAFVADVLPLVAPLTTPHVCEKCGEDLDSASQPIRLSDCAVVPMHSHCSDSLSQAMEQIAINEKKVFPLLPILGALIGALIGAAAWTLLGIAGYMASLVGLLIAFLASKGYDLLGGKPGIMKLITLIICVVLAVVIGNLGVTVYTLHDFYQQEVAALQPWEEAVPETEFIQEVFPMLFEDSEYVGSFIKDNLLGLLFAGLGCFGMLRMAGKKPEDEVKIRILNGRV